MTRLARVLAAGYVGLALVFTLVPFDLQKQARRAGASVGVIERPTSMDEAESQAEASDRVVNGLMLLPLGALITLARRQPSALAGVIVCACLSLSIETAQGLVSATRDAQLSDLLFNAAGGGVGSTVAGLWWSWSAPRTPLQDGVQSFADWYRS